MGTPVKPILIFPKVPGRTYLSPQSFKIRYFCSGPISVDTHLSPTKAQSLAQRHRRGPPAARRPLRPLTAWRARARPSRCPSMCTRAHRRRRGPAPAPVRPRPRRSPHTSGPRRPPADSRGPAQRSRPGAARGPARRWPPPTSPRSAPPRPRAPPPGPARPCRPVGSADRARRRRRQKARAPAPRRRLGAPRAQAWRPQSWILRAWARRCPPGAPFASGAPRRHSA